MKIFIPILVHICIDIFAIGFIYISFFSDYERRMRLEMLKAEQFLKFAKMAMRASVSIYLAFAIKSIDNTIFFTIMFYLLLLIAMIFFVIGVVRISWTDRFVITFVFGIVVLMEIFYPAPSYYKSATLYIITVFRAAFLFIVRRLHKQK
jgi:hypothetical protein